MKNIYEKPEINIISFKTEDNISLSSSEKTLTEFKAVNFYSVLDN